MFKNIKSRHILFAILAFAFILRIVYLDRPDIQGDEATYSFRAIGYFDDLGSEQQTTPVQWFDQLPWWSKLSFHDHPPLVFFVQHLFFSFLGVSAFVARLPFVIFGTLSVYFLYLIGKKLFSEKFGLLAAFILAILNYHIWISRIGYLEGVLIFFILLSFYYFLELLENNSRKNYLLFGLALGLAFLTKYTMFFLLPAFLTYLLIKQRKILFNKKILLAIGIFLIMISPVVFYNIMVYRTRGHFDLQISQLLNQNIAKDWSLFAHPVAKDYFGNFTGIFQSLAFYLNYMVFGLFCLSLIFIIIKLFRKLAANRDKIILLMILFGFLLLQFVFTGAAMRFLPIITPFVALIIAYLIYEILLYFNREAKQAKFFRNSFIIILALLSLYMVVESVNTNLTASAHTPYNNSLRLENYGFRQLDDYLQKQKIDFSHSVVIYDSRLNWFCRTWYFYRHIEYWGDNYLSIEYFLNKINTEGEDYFQKVKGYDNYYFIKGENTVIEPGIKSDAADKFRDFLSKENNLKPELIIRDDGQTAFEVYHFN